MKPNPNPAASDILVSVRVATPSRGLGLRDARVMRHSLGPRIRAAREALKISQDALNKAMGDPDRLTISSIERGKRPVRPEELVCLSELLQREVEYFIDPFVIDGEAKFSWCTEALHSDALTTLESRIGAWIGMLRFLRERNPTVGGPFAMTLSLNSDISAGEALGKCNSTCHVPGVGVVLISAPESDARLSKHLGPWLSPGLAELLNRGVDRGQVSARKAATTLGVTLPQLSSLLRRTTQ